MGPSNKGKERVIDRSTEWSPYVWDDRYQQYFTRRTNSLGKEEYYYLDPTTTTPQGNSDIPRSFSQSSSNIDSSPPLPNSSPPGFGVVTPYGPVATTSYPLAPATGSGQGSGSNYSSSATPTRYGSRDYVSSASIGAYGINSAATDSVAVPSSSTGDSRGPNSLLVRSDSSGSNTGYSLTQYNSITSSATDYSSSGKDDNALGDLTDAIGGLRVNQLPTASVPGASWSPSLGSTHNAPSNIESQAALDSRYRVVDGKNQKRFWKVGRVFMMLWTEPASDTSRSRDGSQSSHFSMTYLQGRAYSEIRRYVVVSEGYGSCICCPIHTYNNRATLKPNLPEPKQHTIIYTSEQAPGEHWYTAVDGSIVKEDLTKDPIKVRSEQSGPEGDLGALSRLNYSKIYTIEKDARVLNIGMVEDNYLSTLTRNSRLKPRDTPIERPRKHLSKSDPKKDEHGHKDKHRGKESEKRHR